MTNCFKKLSLAVLMATAFGVSGSAVAASATGTANATVLTPIAIATGNTLEFGSFSAPTAGTVVVSTAGSRSATGGVLLIPGGTVRAGTFTVTGTGTQGFAISYPGSVNLTRDGGSETMALQVSGDATSALVGGTKTIDIAGTLTVDASQASGSYTGTYSMTVEYN